MQGLEEFENHEEERSFVTAIAQGLLKIKEYYLEEGVPPMGIEFVVDIINHIETLPTNPKIGRKAPEFNEKIFVN